MTHPDDRFHSPTPSDPYWTETCWFTLAVSERRLSGQLYPFFRPNQRVAAGGANPNLWTWNCLTEWRWDDGRRGFGEDHHNWSAAASRRFARGEG